MKTKKTTDTIAEEQNFEQSMKRLEKIVNTLENGSVTLEDSLKMYEEGVDLSKKCLAKLENAEIKIKKLSKDLNGKLSLLEEDIEE
ncbi:MAG: exodeoxyribonuclease VII small subunit [Bacteroidota bacterium]|nr:exodeoxyribonuclease VII small subunit [Bacteroidota bacterium]